MDQNNRDREKRQSSDVNPERDLERGAAPPETIDRADRPERIERAERPERAVSADRANRAARADRPDRAERGDRLDPADRDDNPDRAGKGGKAPRTKRQRQKREGRVFSNPWIYLLFVFGISAILAALCWTAANDVLALNKVGDSAVITITEDDSFSHVVDMLENEGIIEYKALFKLFASFASGADKVSAGTYELTTDMDYRAILNGISSRSDSRMITSVVITEGMNIDQIFAKLEEQGVSSVAKLQDMAANHDYNFSFLKNLELGNYKRLEGYLFPDTYTFYMGQDPKTVINKMLVNFDSKLTGDLRDIIATNGYSVHQIITIASLIEKETDGTDYKNIASVIYNRLNNPSYETRGLLQIDASIQYMLPPGELVTVDHYSSFDSPYNLYLNQGLPPTPISNPGMASIRAAVEPENTKYYYYALGTDGLHTFTRTLAEHNAFLNTP